MNANKNLFVIAPHPDDETLGCGGTIMRKVDEGFNVFIVFLTSGGSALQEIFGITSDPSTEQLKEIRIKEALDVGKILGVPKENYFFLDYEDGKVEASSEKILEDVTRVLNKYAPVEIFSPYSLDVNVDHQATARIIQTSLSNSGLKSSTYKYSIGQKFTVITPIVDKFLNPVRRNMVSVDISEFLSKKELAIQQYKSQFSIICSKQPRPVMTSTTRFLKTKEFFYV